MLTRWGLIGLLLVGACGGDDDATEDAGEDDATSDATLACTTDSDCSDGAFCNGSERCDPDDPLASSLGCVVGTPPCDAADCDETTDMCADCRDADGDGAFDAECGGTDCDDDDADRYPGNTEVCDSSHDEDCDPTTLGADEDDDGFQDAACCNFFDDLLCGRDCDDETNTVNPDAGEACNRADDDCDGTVDEEVLETYYLDDDGDDFGVVTTTMLGCVRPAGYSTTAGDCDDTDVSVFPGATEVCNGEDTDCDGTPDNPAGGCECAVGTPPRACGPRDVDGDLETRGACMSGLQACVAGIWGSCDGAVFPQAETCDGVNEDCDDTTDEDAIDRMTYWRDMDGDMFGDVTMSVMACARPGGFADNSLDCDDDAVGINPSATEVCDDIDNNCAGGVDEPPAVASCGSMVGVTYACQAGGMCAITDCPGGTDDCDGVVGNGCEQMLDTLAHCGMCDNACFHRCGGAACDELVDVNAGGGHTCAIRASGDAVCWGDNANGQLGDGTMTRRATPALVGVISNITAISAGSAHTCAASGGRVYCWGSNNRGQAGSAPSASVTSPQQVGTLMGVTHVAAGGEFSCAIASGEVWCWGRNGVGQLGNQGTTDSFAPRAVRDPDDLPNGIDDAVDIAAGAEHACAVRTDGTVLCWGSNIDRQLGDGLAAHGDPTCDASFIDCSRVAVYASGLSAADSVTAHGTGDHTCALSGSSISCWGDNDFRQATNSATDPVPTPTSVPGSADAISAGETLTCRRSGTTLQCWGSNASGQIGSGAAGAGPFGPTAVSTISAATVVSAGASFACATQSTGRTMCWGEDTTNQLGDGNPATNQNAPVQVSPF